MPSGVVEGSILSC